MMVYSQKPLHPNISAVYLDGLNVKAKGTSPEKLVSNPSRGNAKLNVTLKVQSLAALGARNLLFLDNPVCKVIDTKYVL